MKLKQTNFICYATMAFFFLIFSLPTNIFAQFYAIDGNNCNATNGVEWPMSSATTDSDVGNVPSSSNLLYFWGGVRGSNVVMAIERKGSGNALFAIYLNTDCNSANNDINKGGADIALIFNLNQGAIQDYRIFNYDTTVTSKYKAGTKTFVGDLGNSICADGTTDGQFMEIGLSLTDIFDMCNTTGINTCGNLTVTYVDIHAGGVFPSALKDSFNTSAVIATNFPPASKLNLTDTVACQNETLVLNASNSLNGDEGRGTGDSITSYLWDMDYNGTFATDYTGESPSVILNTNGIHQVALIVTDLYGCNDTAYSAINTYGRPVSNGTINYNTAPAPNCTNLTYDGTASVDNTNADNLMYNWDFGDGNYSSSDTGTHIYPSCTIYNGSFLVADPDNNGHCPAAPMPFVAALPVDLINFEANLTVANKVQLNWSTASEQNNKGFTILKSVDGVNWMEMDFVTGNGNTHEIKYYQWSDASINQSKTVYYRLKQEDFNGTVAFSDFRKVTITKESQPMVYPNPVVDKLNINFGSTIGEQQPVQVTAWNQFGQQVYSQTIVGLTEHNIDFSNAHSGVYLIEIRVNNQIFSQTFVKP